MPDGELLRLMLKFKKIDVQISIDGIEDEFEYNRWPASWQDLTMNLRRYFTLYETYENFQISISHSVSVFTLYNIPYFLEWCRKAGLPEPYLGLVSRPKHYSITVFSTDAKKEIETWFRSKKDPVLERLIDAMWAHDDSNELDNLAKYLKIIDKQRNQSFPKVFPKTYQLLGKSCQTLYQLY
jgi:hypothetical protein